MNELGWRPRPRDPLPTYPTGLIGHQQRPSTTQLPADGLTLGSTYALLAPHRLRVWPLAKEADVHEAVSDRPW